MPPRRTPRSQGLWKAHQAELDRLGGEERRTRWRARWGRLRAFWGRLGTRAKRWAAIAALISTLGKPVVKLVLKIRELYLAGSIGPAELPKTGQPTTAMDFVPEPKPVVQPSPKDPRSSTK